MNFIPFKRQVLAGFLGLILFLGILSYVMNVEVNHDESMYIGASVLSRKGLTLYQDFSYVQMPYLPLLYGLVYKVTNVSHYLLVSKLINIFFALFSGWTIYKIAWILSKDSLFSWLAVLLLEFNEIIIYIMGKSSNDIMPLSFSILGFYLFIIGFSGKAKSILFLLSGVCLAIATGAKLYYVMIIFPFIATSTIFPRTGGLKQKLFKTILPFLLGLFVGSLSVFYYFFKDIDAFWINNWEYHSLNTKWRELTGYTRASIKSLDFLRNSRASLRQKVNFIWLSPALVLSSSLLAIATVTAFLPTPLWRQYFAPPVPFAILTIVCLYTQLNPKGKIIAKRAMIFLTALTLIFGIGSERLYARLNTLLAPEQWKVVAVHQTAQNIRTYVDRISKTNPDAKIATLAPLYAVEGGLKIYNELSAGPFMYRIGDLMSSEKRAKVKGTSAKTIQTLFDRDPPVAILVGFEGDLDRPLIEYAVKNDYTKIEEKFDGGVLYLRQTS
jgi:hypothetical protein